MRVVASLTTIPYNYSTLLVTLKTLLNQTYRLDAIYLGLPKNCRRLNKEYPPIPSEIAEICTIVPCEDFGPITKLYGALVSEEDPDTVIITFDDDDKYAENLVEILLKHHLEFPNAAVGFGNRFNHKIVDTDLPLEELDTFGNIYSVPNEGLNVDFLYGYSGVLYVRKFFPAKEKLIMDFFNYAFIDNDAYCNDDVIISGYLSMHNIERRSFRDIPMPKGIPNPIGFGYRLSVDPKFVLFQMRRLLRNLRKLNMYTKLYGYPYLPSDFNWKDYLTLNRDVAQVHKDEKGAIEHWMSYGYYERRQYLLPPDDFNWKLYLLLNKDIYQVCKDERGAIEHWLTIGRHENRKYTVSFFPQDFDWKKYIELNPDVAQNAKNEMDAIDHWINYGYYEGRKYK
ncbi:MAG: hypothetical protein QXW79_01155 [Thermoplasmata archaeon]